MPARGLGFRVVRVLAEDTALLVRVSTRSAGAAVSDPGPSAPRGQER